MKRKMKKTVFCHTEMEHFGRRQQQKQKVCNICYVWHKFLVGDSKKECITWPTEWWLEE
jgi:hypothetical protein